MNEIRGVSMKDQKMGKYHQYEVEGALSDLQRAEEHKKNPDMMKHVHKMAKKKIKEIRSIADLRHAANSVGHEEEKEGE